MADTFNVKPVFDKPNYNKGDPITVTFSGTVTQQVSTTETDHLHATIKKADGTTQTLDADLPVTSTSDVPEDWSVVVIEDSSGRKWTIGTDGKTASAVA